MSAKETSARDEGHVPIRIEEDAHLDGARVLQRVVGEMTDFLVILDDEWRCSYASERAAAEAGVRREDLLGKVLWEVFPQLIGSDVEDVLVQAMAERRGGEFEVFSPVTGHWCAVRLHPHDDGLYVYGRDVTSRKRTEEDLRRHKDRYRALIEDSPDPIAELDRDLRYLYVNQATERITGIPRAAFIGKTAAEMGYPPEVYGEWKRAAERAIQTGLAVRAPIVYDHPSGLRAYDVRIVPILDAEGTVTSILSHPRTVTDMVLAERRAQAHASQQRAVAELGRRALDGAPLQALLDEAAMLVTRALEVDFSKVLELQPDGRDLALVAGVGWQEGVVGRLREGAGASSPAGFVLLTKQALLVEDVSTETRFDLPAYLREHGVASLASVVTHKADQPYGVLSALSSRRRHFTEDDVAFLQSIANILATAIDRERRDAIIRQLSTPVLNVRPRLLLLPLIGALDDRRAQQLTDQLLQAVRAQRARVVVIDLTGAVGMDRNVADLLLRAVEAARLLGARAVITGVSQSTSQALVESCADLASLRTVGDLQGGLEEAKRLLDAPSRALLPSRKVPSRTAGSPSPNGLAG
jgi:PAS domain S-box-containing protein